MAYKQHEPVTERVMLKQRYAGHHTICQTLRDIYVAIEDDDIKLKLRVAMAMAKSMHERLKVYAKEAADN